MQKKVISINNNNNNNRPVTAIVSRSAVVDLSQAAETCLKYVRLKSNYTHV